MIAAPPVEPIDPLSLAPAVWFDPSDLSSMFQDAAGTVAAAVGNPVARINDKSGNGRHATQANAAKQPVLRQAGSVVWLDFDGVDDFLKTAAFTVNQPDTLAAAALFEDAAANDGNVLDGAIGRQIVGAWTGNNYRFYAGTQVNAGTRDAQAHVLVATMNGATSELMIDGTPYAGNAGAGVLSGGLYIGCANSETLSLLDGRFFGGGVIGRVLTASEKAGLRAHLAAKAGI